MGRTELDAALSDLAGAIESEPTLRGSLVLYGSAARGDWDEIRSDVNLLLVVEDASPTALHRLTPAVTAWHKRGFTPPLLMGRREWSAAADVFPIEITDMRVAHRVVLGADPLVDLKVEPADLRRALETALRGKLLRLRQAWVRFGDQAPVLGGFAVASISELLVLMRCTAHLIGRVPGSTPAETIQVLAGELGASGPVVAEVARHRRDKEWSCPPGQFAAYLDAVERLVELVDNPQRGVH